ncbi:glycosyltransferase family 2 protein [Desulfovibrio sp. OttesenSCG-928-G11]|nr:glycosyltransferase family 2 protein [Desulfovibrio sp. OttesenSCG-928-G11]
MGQKIQGISFIIPAYNEEKGIRTTLARLRDVLCGLGVPYEILVVNDGSRDATASIVRSLPGITLLNHPTNIGYGNALKSGMLYAKYDWIGIVDADESYPVHEIPKLVAALEEGFDMAVAARENLHEHDSFFKGIARSCYRKLISLLSGAPIQDPNSGLRIFSRRIGHEFFPFLCGRFSFTTSLSILAVMKPYFVKFVPVQYQYRAGLSHVRHFKDSLVTLHMIMQGVCYYNPVKFFFYFALLSVFGIGIPAMLLAMFRMPTLSLYFLIFSCAMSLLLGIGFLSDIVRVSAEKGLTLDDERKLRCLYPLECGNSEELKKD